VQEQQEQQEQQELQSVQELQSIQLKNYKRAGGTCTADPALFTFCKRACDMRAGAREG
jgi:hypothetical protein